MAAEAFRPGCTAEGRVDAETTVVPDASGDYDVVLVSVRRDQLASACAGLTCLAGRPAVVFFGNNPGGHLSLAMSRRCVPGFPWRRRGHDRRDRRLRTHPAAADGAAGRRDPRLAELEAALASHGFAVQRVADMDGWLVYHAAFVACIAAALYRCGTDPVRLAADRETLALMCQAITEAFAALRASGIAGLPRNLAVLHTPLLRPVAVRYWARTMRSPMGELCFAAHSGTPRRRCGPWAATWQPGSPARQPWPNSSGGGIPTPPDLQADRDIATRGRAVIRTVLAWGSRSGPRCHCAR